MDRRQFLEIASGLGLSALIPRESHSQSSSGPIGFGVIGVGARGSFHVTLLLELAGAEVRGIADVDMEAAEKSASACAEKTGSRPDLYTRDAHDYQRMLERDDLDAVVIATPWRLHTPMAVDAMNAGKHAFIEVPAAVTLDECWQLVESQERTGLHCTMLENVCYGREELMVLKMCRDGLFGELTHGEAAYIHDLREQMQDIERGTGSWRTPEHTTRNGNLYPTHGLGPVAQYMSVNRGDRFDFLVSMSSPALGRAQYAKEHFPADHPRNQVEYIAGDINSSLIKTAKGRSILVQWDTTTPRPYTRLNLIQGTRGMFAGYPNRIAVEGRGETHTFQDLEPYRKEFEHPLWKRVGEEAERTGGHGGMDYVMMWRIVDCLKRGLPMDQDVYDAAAWSAVAPLSERSVGAGSRPVDFPDFTRGRWRDREPLGIVS